MKSYQIYQDKIAGYRDVAETVHTVEKIAASSAHTLKTLVRQLSQHADAVETMIASIASSRSIKKHPLLNPSTGSRHAVILCTGDKGLVGGLWNRTVTALFESTNQDDTIITVGTKGARLLAEEKRAIAHEFPGLPDLPKSEDIEPIAAHALNAFLENKYASVKIIYPHFVSIAEQKPMLVPFLPFSNKPKSGEQSDLGLPIYEPSRDMITRALLEKYIRVFFHKTMLEAKLSELSGRIIAMEHAGAKTETIIQKTIWSYLKERRSLSTQKQLESFAAGRAL